MNSNLQPTNFALRNKQTDLDRILNYLKSGNPSALDELNEKEKDKLDKMMFAERQLGKFLKKRDVAHLISAKYQNSVTGQPLSLDQGYRIIRDTERIFGQVNKIDPNFLAGLAYDLAMDTIRLARERHDVRGLNAAAKNLIEIIKLFNTGANKIPANLLDRININFQVKPELLGVKPISMSEIDDLLDELNQPKHIIDITNEQRT
jgi:hypothetical protein